MSVEEVVFARLGRWCYDRRWIVVGLWLATLVVANIVLQGTGGSEMRTEFTLPNVESSRGLDILEDDFGGSGGGNAGQIVFQADQGVSDSEVREAMEEAFREVEGVQNVQAVQSPYLADDVPPQVAARLDANDDGLVDRLVSPEGDIAYAEVEFPTDLNVEEMPTITDKVEEALPTGVDGLHIELGSQYFAEFEPPASEALGVAFAIFILILSFGSVLAMGLPIGVALAGIGVALTLAGIVSQLVTIPDMVTFLGPMIGLGVGIDYALFIVTRFRENVHRGHDTRESTVIAMDTAGRAVLFAGTTVVISLLGMVLMGLGFVTGVAIGTALVVAATVVASLTLLPALLSLAGPRIETTRWRGLIAAGFVAVGLVGVGLRFAPLTIGFPLAAVTLAVALVVYLLKREGAFGALNREVPRRAPRPLAQTAAYRWSRLIQRRPWSAALIGAGALVVLAIPLAGLRHGFSDTSNYPEDTTTRQAHELMVQGFGEGFNGPITLVGELPEGGLSEQQLQEITTRFEGVEGVAQVAPPQPSENGESVMWLMFPDSAPQDEETTQLVNVLRGDVLPPVQEATGLDVVATGTVPINVDFTDYLADRLPFFLAAVLGLSFLLLMTVFRSVLVPVKAVVMNLLSVGASYGVVVAIFQWGWLGSLFGIEGAPIEPFVPMMLFAIVFGLSMDYEVFLLSRVREEWDRTGDSHTSVADGLAATARVITAAALIMVFVFGSFILESDRTSKLMGLGLATAVLLDATVVRMLLVPATMELLGDRNWWLPRWLDRILPRVNVEGHEAPAEREQTAPREELEPV
jgi:putative drug exporter of the RND superfamily